MLLTALELDEVFHFPLRAGAETPHPLGDAFAPALVEEVADAQVECLQDAQERVETDFVLALLHAREIRLVHADALGELHLGQLSLPAELADLSSDQLNLNWRTCRHFREVYATFATQPPQYARAVEESQVREGSQTSNRLFLLRELVKRDLAARFAGSTLGRVWAIAQPLGLILVFWFVFSTMVPRTFGTGRETYIHFLVAGLLPWLTIAEGVSRSASSIVENGSIIKRLAFRTEMLVIVPNAAAVVLELIALLLATAFASFDLGVSRQLWLLPVALVLQFGLMLGVGCMVAVMQVYFRDVAQVLAFALTIIFYLSPILYPPSERFATIFRWNPLTPLVGLFRSAMLSSPIPSASSLVFLLVVVVSVVALGLLMFRRAEANLADYV
ncbi:MAG TPA: ABC transporter permease [Thermoanaerobaculia bacterium]|nr:ABC transporter permease [Thermoanaerobaculia bacterium]